MLEKWTGIDELRLSQSVSLIKQNIISCKIMFMYLYEERHLKESKITVVFISGKYDIQKNQIKACIQNKGIMHVSD